MKIGIMTFWWSEDNYGQLLQCYALQKYLRDQGHDAYLIRYDPRNDYVKSPILIRVLKACNPIKLYTYIKQKRREKKSVDEQIKYPRHFNEFRNEYIIQSDKIYTTYDQLKNDPPEADVYIVGSDQVWCWSLFDIKKTRNIINAFFLNFGDPNTKRISYAASWGSETISNSYKELIIPLITKFDAISVREKVGIELCKQCGVNDALCVPDPTFLLNPNEYIDLTMKEKVKSKEKYIFLYMLNNGFSFDIDNVYKWASSNGLSVKYVTGNNLVDKHEKVFPSVLDWLSLIDKAEYIITNSFHCSVFSILFNKKFAVVPLTGRLKGLNSRLSSLFELCKMKNRFIESNCFDVLNNPCECNISEIQTMTINYLKEVVHAN